jgi:hypothetical protein
MYLYYYNYVLYIYIICFNKSIVCESYKSNVNNILHKNNFESIILLLLLSTINILFGLFKYYY